MQKRNVRSCGKISVRLIQWSVCYHSLEPSTARGSFCFIFFEFNEGSAKATVMTGCRSLFLFAPLFPSSPALSCLMPVSSSSSSCCFVRATHVLHSICFSSARMLFLQPFLSDLLITFFKTPAVCFALFCFVFLFSSSSFVSLFVWSGLFCCVLAPGTLAFHLLYLDELRMFGLLCFTVCGH